MTKYVRRNKERTALRAGFVTADGTPNVPEYNLHMNRRRALNGGFVTADGEPNLTAYNLHILKRTALNAGFATADGKPLVAAYRQHSRKRVASSHPDASEDHPSVTGDGSADAAGNGKNDSRECQEDEAAILPYVDDQAFQEGQDASLGALVEVQGAADTAPGPQQGVQTSASSSRKRSAARAPKESGPKRPKGKAVKQEPAFPASAFPSPTAGVEHARINTAQLSHVPTTSYAMIDLTGDDGSPMTVFTARHTDEAMVSTGKQTYDPALDKVFPIRAPAHPEHVHPDYADPDDPSRCAPHVVLENIRFYTGGASPNEHTLWRRARTSFNGDLPYESKKLFIEALKRSCEEELRATMQGRQPPSSQRVRVDAITDASQCDSPEEFAALRNQYGGFLTDYAPASQPSLRNARIVCLFAGSRLSSAEDSRQYLDQLGAESGWKALQDYAANAQNYGKHGELAWAPYGGGNMGQYLNSTFKPGVEGKLQVDSDRTNAFLCPVIVDLKDRHGKARKESMLMVVQDRPIVEGKQIKLDYGDNYTLDARESALRMPSRPVKQEFLEGQVDTGSTRAAGRGGPREPPRPWDPT